MKYDKVSIDYHSCNYCRLIIDGREWRYYGGGTDGAGYPKSTSSLHGPNYDDYFMLNTPLPMDKDNPKKTLDRFFKLMMLQ